MKIKDKTVKLDNLHPMMIIALIKTENVCKEINGKDYIMTITSGNDGKHKQESKHYENKAVDIRNKDMTYPQATHTKIRIALGENYDVIEEKTHIHIEYDPK